MARGDSGRIVIEVDPETKRQLYAALDLTGSTLKDWFVKRASDFCDETNQPSLFHPSDLAPSRARRDVTTRPNLQTAESLARKKRNHGKRSRSPMAA